ncbi:MAG: MFS transporter [Candidatus Promineifilaceae bacterium]
MVYGLGDWGTSASTTARNLYWLYFLVSVVGLPAGYAGLALLLGRLWDSVNDPLIGILTDRTRTRWGRRRPFLLLAAVPFGLAFLLLFVAPPLESQLALTLYFSVVAILFDTCYTLINVPYTAMLAELSPDYDERSSLAGWRVAIAILAALAVAAGFEFLAEDVIGRGNQAELGLTPALRLGYGISAGLWGISLIITPLILFVKLREPDRPPPERGPLHFGRTLREVMANRPFRLAASMYLLSFFTVDMVVAVIAWYLIYYIGVRPGFDNLILGIVLGLAFVSMPVTVRLMRRFGKRETFIASMALFVVLLVIISAIPPGAENAILAVALFAGLGYGAANVIPWAMVADVVEVDELQTGKRREGVYAGYLVFFRKLASGLALFLSSMFLARSGFVESRTGSLAPVTQPESALLALRLLVSVLPAAMLVLAIAVAWRYPLDRATHERIRAELAGRH